MAAIRLTAPTDLATGDQPLQAAYILDVARNGAWLVQHSADGVPASKPPLYNWLAAIGVIASGSSHELILKLPSLVAGLVTLGLTWNLGRKIAGVRAAVIAGALLCTSPLFVKHIYFARTDMLLTMLVAAQIASALSQRTVVYWSCAALALLTKGPVGMVLPIAALSALWWWNGELRERWRAMRFWQGLALSMVPFALWFTLAVSSEPRLFDQLVYAETLDRFSSESSKSKEHRHFLYYVPHFLGRMAPVSFFFIGSLFVMRRAKRAEAIAPAIAWVFAVLLVLSLVPSKRADRLFPLLPAACIAAGWALDRDLATPRSATRRAFAFSAIAIGCAGVAIPVIFARGDKLSLTNETLALIAAAAFVGCSAVMLYALRRFKLDAAVAALIAALLIGTALYQYASVERLTPMRGNSRSIGVP